MKLKQSYAPLFERYGKRRRSAEIKLGYNYIVACYAQEYVDQLFHIRRQPNILLNQSKKDSLLAVFFIYARTQSITSKP